MDETLLPIYKRLIMAMPLEIIGLGKDSVEFVWDESEKQTFSAWQLRVACNCAHCVSEITGERTLDPNSIAKAITVTNMELVGNYGVSIHFSDSHTTGIYRFAALKDMTPYG